MTASDPKRWACVARMGGFGDNLIASSVFPGLKKRYGNLEVITSPLMCSLYENNPHNDKLSVREDGDPPWGDGHSWQAWFASRAREYAFFVNLSHSVEATGVALKVQTQYWWPVEFRRKLFGRSYLELVHDICGIPYDEIAPQFFPTDAEVERARETKRKVGERVIGWMLAGSRIDKWHPELDVAVARALRELRVPIILFGGPGKDLELAKLIEAEVKKRNRSTEGLHFAISESQGEPLWPPRRVCSQVQQCDVIVGPDTGPMWAVAMGEMPKLLMVSHASPENISKHWRNTTTLHADPQRVPCWPCHRLHDDASTCVPNADRNGAACISDISVDTIVSEIGRLLKELEDGSNQRVHAKGDVGLVPGRGGADASLDAGDRSVVRFPHQYERL